MHAIGNRGPFIRQSEQRGGRALPIRYVVNVRLGRLLAQEARVLGRCVPHRLAGTWCGRGSSLANACHGVDTGGVMRRQKGARVSIRHLAGDRMAARHTNTNARTHTYTYACA